MKECGKKEAKTNSEGDDETLPQIDKEEKLMKRQAARLMCERARCLLGCMEIECSGSAWRMHWL